MATEKMLRITMPDSSVWEVPAKTVARNRATYYVENAFGTDFDKEFDFTMYNDYKLKDWAAGNMNWEDVAGEARKVSSREMDDGDYQEGWVNGDKEIVEVEVPDVIDAEFPDLVELDCKVRVSPEVADRIRGDNMSGISFGGSLKPLPGHVRLGELMAAWDKLHVKDTGEIGFCDLDAALQGAGVRVDTDTRPPKLGDYVDIVFDGPPGPEAGRFVEVEDREGKGIRIGHWLHRDDGFWVLRFNWKQKGPTF